MAGNQNDQRVVEPRKIIGKIQGSRGREFLRSETTVIRYQDGQNVIRS